jgi:hypothetical protein
MRPFARRAWILGTCLSAGCVWSGCEQKQATEYVTGISTQVSVPRDLKAVRVEVTIGGFSQFCRGYKVYDGKVQLPRSLGTFPNSDSALQNSGPVTYTIVGLTEEFNETSENPIFAICQSPKIGANNARILRRSRQPYIKDEVLFLPMPLKYSCYDKNCEGDDKTCKGGKCVDANLSEADARKLPKYSPELVDGTGSTCFSSALCLAAALPAITVDPATCTYAVANTKATPPLLPGVPNPISGPTSGEGVNVEVIYDGGLNREVLDLDKDEGFFIPDAANSQRFKLADGLCEMVRGTDSEGKPTTHRITAVRASGTCRAKSGYQPLCQNDQLKAMGLDETGTQPNPPPAGPCSTVELKPPQSVLMVLVDNTTTHQAFFDALKKTSVDPNDEDTLVEPAIKGALSDPAFQRTDIGLIYAPGGGGCATTGAPDISPGPALTARDPILADLKAKPTVNQPVALEGALERSYAVLRQPQFDPYFRRAVLVLTNSGFDDALQCPGPGTPASPIASAEAAHADKAKRIDTYVMQLPKSPPKPNGAWAADALAIAGGTDQASYKAAEATTKFQQIVNSLGTCVYDVDDNGNAPKEGDTVSFNSPLTGEIFTVAFNKDGCKTEDAPGNGWNYAEPNTAPQGKRRIHLCAGDKGSAQPKQSCAAYRAVLEQTTKFSAVYQQPPIPVPIFAFKNTCPAP